MKDNKQYLYEYRIDCKNLTFSLHAKHEIRSADSFWVSFGKDFLIKTKNLEKVIYLYTGVYQFYSFANDANYLYENIVKALTEKMDFEIQYTDKRIEQRTIELLLMKKEYTRIKENVNDLKFIESGVV